MDRWRDLVTSRGISAGVDSRPSSSPFGTPPYQKGWWQMTCTVHVAWDERLTDYHFGPSHPVRRARCGGRQGEQGKSNTVTHGQVCGSPPSGRASGAQ